MDSRLPHKFRELINRYKHPAIIGCGGIGWNLAIALTMMGAKELTLVDHDTLEQSNCQRIPAWYFQVGMRKVTALRDQLHCLGETILVHTYPNQIIESAQLTFLERNVDIVFATTDNASSRMLVYDYCKLHGLPYLSLAYDYVKDHEHITIADSASLSWGDDVGGYTRAHSSPIVAWMAVAFGLLAKAERLQGECTLQLPRLLMGRNKMKRS